MEWTVVGADKKPRPSQDHKDLEKKYGVRGLANTLASSEVANLERQGFRFYTVEKAPQSPPVDKSDDIADYTYVLIQDNRWGDYAGFMRWKDEEIIKKPIEQRVHLFVEDDEQFQPVDVGRFSCLLEEDE